VIKLGLLVELLVREIDFIQELRFGLCQLRADFANKVLTGAQHMLVLIDHLPVLHDCLTVRPQAHLVLQHCLLVLALHASELFLEFTYAVVDVFVHALRLVLQLLVNLIKPDGILMNADNFLLIDAYSLCERRLVHDSEGDVPDLLHREHARLLEAIALQIVRIGVFLHFKLAQIGHFTAVFLVNRLVARFCRLAVIKVVAVEQRLPRTVVVTLFHARSLFFNLLDLRLEVIAALVQLVDLGQQNLLFFVNCCICHFDKVARFLP